MIGKIQCVGCHGRADPSTQQVVYVLSPTARRQYWHVVCFRRLFPRWKAPIKTKRFGNPNRHPH